MMALLFAMIANKRAYVPLFSHVGNWVTSLTAPRYAVCSH